MLAISALVIGLLLLARGLWGNGGHGEIFALVGSVLFGSSLISLTILACATPRWPVDDRLRKEESYRSITEDE
jgi:hypothetical protein